MTVCVHLCRGNFKSAWVAQGGYEPVAEILLNEMKIDGFFLEYDDERSGDFAPLRFAPKSATIVLGLMSSKQRRRGAQGRGQAPHRGGDQIRAARPMRAEPPVRLLLDRARQRPLRGRPMDQARAPGRDRRGGLGRGVRRVRTPSPGSVARAGEGARSPRARPGGGARRRMRASNMTANLAWFDTDKCFIDGRWVAAQSGDLLPLEDPSRGVEIGAIARGTERRHRRRGRRGGAGARGEWGRLTATERGRLLVRLADLIENPDRGARADRGHRRRQADQAGPRRRAGAWRATWSSTPAPPTR